PSGHVPRSGRRGGSPFRVSKIAGYSGFPLCSLVVRSLFRGSEISEFLRSSSGVRSPFLGPVKCEDLRGLLTALPIVPQRFGHPGVTQRPQGCRLQLAHLLLRYAGSCRDFRRGLVHPIPPLDFLSLPLWKPLHGPVKGIPYSNTLQGF